jgi:hypothetical protein
VAIGQGFESGRCRGAAEKDCPHWIARITLQAITIFDHVVVALNVQAAIGRFTGS